MKRLEEYFNEIDDPRQNGKVKHLIGEILTISLCAVASGVESSGTRNGIKYNETRYFLMSIADVQSFAKAVRNHWAIENNLHWSLDVIFKDDDCLIKNKIIAENMAILRRIAFNRMKMFDNSRLKTKKMKCAFDDDFRYQVLFTNFHA